jgi:hypothetical protein
MYIKESGAKDTHSKVGKYLSNARSKKETRWKNGKVGTEFVSKEYKSES